MKLPVEPQAQQLVAIIDSREQHPLDLAPLRCEVGTLTTGDYSLRGLEHVVSIERKSLEDLVACCGGERERFEREVQRLLAYPVRALVVESTWAAIEMQTWRSKITAKQVMGSLLGWIAQGLPVITAGSHDRAGELVSRMLYIAARRRWREARELIQHVSDAAAGEEVSRAE